MQVYRWASKLLEEHWDGLPGFFFM
ncbi:hypothetical protein [Paenibacillus ihbetae]